MVGAGRDVVLAGQHHQRGGGHAIGVPLAVGHRANRVCVAVPRASSVRRPRPGRRPRSLPHARLSKTQAVQAPGHLGQAGRPRPSVPRDRYGGSADLGEERIDARVLVELDQRGSGRARHRSMYAARAPARSPSSSNDRMRRSSISESSSLSWVVEQPPRADAAQRVAAPRTPFGSATAVATATGPPPEAPSTAYSRQPPVAGRGRRSRARSQSRLGGPSGTLDPL